MYKPLVLLIRDGWGIGPDYGGNAVKVADTPNMDRLLAEHPHCILEASGQAVGVRAGSQGSSEVGHLNMGAGRIVKQEIIRVDTMISTGELFKSPRLLEAIKQCKSNGSKFHLMGLVQDQGVHATQGHLFAILKFLAQQDVDRVFIHFFSDGRDTPPQSALTYFGMLQEKIAEYGIGQIASIQGRYWSMDRGENWDRTEKAYRAMLYGEGLTAKSAQEAIESAYQRAEKQIEDGEDIIETDEFIRPTLIVTDDGKPVGLIEPGDVVLHFNYRQDRALQLTKAFVEQGFTGFERGPVPDVFFMGLTCYYDEFPYALVPPMNMTGLLGEVLSKHGLRQLRIAEFQKYRHVTSFFNGKRLVPYEGEDRIKVDSITIPENQKPEMSAHEVTDLVLVAIEDGVSSVRKKAQMDDKATLEFKEFTSVDADSLHDTYDVIILNYANGDMVGHTGVFEATVKAIEVVDTCVGKVVEAVLARNGMIMITADHGNAEEMTDIDSGTVQTAHTTNPVEFVLVSRDPSKYKMIDQGKLADISPTILEFLGIQIPIEMTAKSLII